MLLSISASIFQTLFIFECMDNTDRILQALQVELWCSTSDEICVLIQCLAQGSLYKINCKDGYSVFMAVQTMKGFLEVS